MKSRLILLGLLGCLCLGVPSPGVFAADPAEPTYAATTAITPAAVQAKIKEVEGSTALGDSSKTKLLDLYQGALGFLEQLQNYDRAAEEFTRARNTASDEAKATRAKMEQGKQRDPIAELGVTKATPLAKLEPLLLKEKADLAAVEAKLGDLTQAISAEAERPTVARQRLTEARRRQEQITPELKSSPPPNELPAVTEARRWRLQSENRALSAEIRMLDEELRSQPMRIELLKAERDRNAHSVDWIGARVQWLEKLVGEQRLAEAEQVRREAEQAELEAAGKHPLVQKLARQNAALSEEITKLAQKLEKVTAEDDAAKKDAARISELLRNTRQKLEIAGLSEALGRILLEQRRRLPESGKFREKTKATEQEIARAGLNQIQHEEERQLLRDATAYLAELTADLTETERAEIEGELRVLVEKRRDLMDQAIQLDQNYMRALGELDFAHRQVLDSANSYRAFLDERLLWIRSSAAPDRELLTHIPDQVEDLLSPTNWSGVLQILATRVTQSPLPVVTLIVVAILLLRSKQIRGKLLETGRFIHKPSRDRFLFTLQALAWTLLLAAPWPLLLGVGGWEIHMSHSATEFAKSVSRAMFWVAEAFFYLKAFRVLCITDGLAATHFGWPEDSLKRLRRGLRRLMLVMLPAAFVTIITITYDAATMGGGLGRIGFVVIVVSLAVFFHRLFHPKTGVLQTFMAQFPDSLIARLNKFWLALTIAVPLALGVLALLGYLYTAGTLTGRFIETMWFILVLIVVHQMVMRWLLLVRRKLALKAALERREAAQAAAAAPSEAIAQPQGGEATLDVVEETKVDLVALGEETRQLLFYSLVIVGIVGIWMIWSKVLPAFGFLDQVTLWHQVGVVDGEEQNIPVTLADLVLALLIAVITFVGAKRFPAFLEIALLQRLEMTAGGRYAAKTLSSYVIAAVGVFLVFNTIGASWSKLQWLVAALGVGIGFGLQEIVANFISGLIILFERPIRVGDIVTVGDTSGVVTRIQIRATTIRNWERKELLVPNKEFITGRLLNWSLSDQTTRILITVGLVYGGDVTKAMALMAEAAEEHERILDDPPPFVSFEGFGDNALVLNLRCYTSQLDFRLQTTSELHEAINDKFNRAGLVIAFPQRDVHLDTSRPLEIRIRHDKQDPDTGPAAP
jgi:potassium efflux system protein